jgi:hypothetical protein
MRTSSSVRTSRIGLLVLLAAVAPAIHCASDPVHDEEVTALGSEVPGIPEGPYHRAGQPCTVCHGPEGPASTQFSIAGTIFDSPSTLVGVGKVQVLLVDSIGSSPPTPPVTNCVGNFYLTPEQWTPEFPVAVQVYSAGMMATMLTQIGRATSCAECHTDPPGSTSPGHVYLGVALNPDEEAMCPVSPNAGGCAGDAGP